MIDRWYIAGPMSGIPEHGFPAFRAAATNLRARGYQIVSPVELDEQDGFDDTAAQVIPGGEQWARFLMRDLQVLAQPDVVGVVCLPGWEKSKGALLETHVARELGKRVVAYNADGPLNDIPAVPSGEQRIVHPETGGEKGRKPQRYELVPWPAVGRVAEVYAFGATKYADHNWRRGYDWSLSFGALVRHLAAFWAGEDRDPESGLSHVAHAGFHVLALLTFEEEHPSLDDRPRA